ncbi:MAG: MetS family NSS transporter small subunit [bacterium]
MDISAIVMLIIACVVLYGGLFVTVNKAMKSSKENEEK